MPKPLPGVTSHMIKTPRLAMHVLRSGPPDGIPVIFMHGNFSSALYWEETMLALPAGYQGIAPDLRGYGWTEDLLVDASRGVADWADDMAALMDTLNLAKAHFVGWSLGAGVLYGIMSAYPGRVISTTLVCPVPTFGFAGTRDASGTPCYADFAGTGGGLVNPDFVKRIMAGDRSADDPNSPRNIINTFYYKAPFRAAREEDFLTGALAEKMGSDRYPGDAVPSANWPGVGPGAFGPLNAASAKGMAGLDQGLVGLAQKPPVLWIHGSHDMIVADNSMFDMGTLGKLGYIPGWPGDDVYPPQPMITQMRHVLQSYAAAGGSFSEHVIPETAHSPHIEKPAEFNALFHPFLKKTGI